MSIEKVFEQLLLEKFFENFPAFNKILKKWSFWISFKTASLQDTSNKTIADHINITNYKVCSFVSTFISNDETQLPADESIGMISVFFFDSWTTP